MGSFDENQEHQNEFLKHREYGKTKKMAWDIDKMIVGIPHAILSISIDRNC